MSAKAYDKKTAAFAGFLIQNVPVLTDEGMDRWMNDPDGIKKFLSGLNTSIAAIPTAKPPTLALVKTTSLGEVTGKKTNKCFTGKRWVYRDGDIDRWLPVGQPGQEESLACVYQLQNPQGTTFREMAAAALKLGSGTSLDLLAKALKENNLTFTLSAIEQLVERQEGGEDVGLRTDGYANLAFVEDSDGSVSVLSVRRDRGRWYGYVYRLDYDSWWDAGFRLLLRNSDASTL